MDLSASLEGIRPQETFDALSWTQESRIERERTPNSEPPNEAREQAHSHYKL
mgnify:CR=1 FL=1